MMRFKLTVSHVSLGHHFRSAFVLSLNSEKDVELFKGQQAISTQNLCVEAGARFADFSSPERFDSKYRCLQTTRDILLEQMKN